MCDEAVAATGLDDFEGDWFLQLLSAWAEDLQQPNLNDFGRDFLRKQAVRDLARRLRVMDTLRRNPEIAEVAIPPIVYVTGLARSGTTLLHNLLGLHPMARTFKRWELVDPLPPPEAATYATDSRVAEVQAQVDRMRGSYLERMHWVNADDPEECVWGFLDVNSMMGQAPSSWMPSWRAAMNETDQSPAFENYRRLVQLLLWKNPVPEGGFLVLKAPQILRRVADFAAVFPEVRFVVTHRDPYRCTVSLAVLCESLSAAFQHENALANDGQRSRFALAANRGAVASGMEFADTNPTRVTHVAYPDLVRDPAGVVQRVLDCDLSGLVDRFLAEQRAGKRAAPPRELDDMGYDRDSVWGDATFARYVDRFGIEPEGVRLAG
jgi:hypothetical protein